MIKCFIFDLDGTLLNTLDTIRFYLNKMLKNNSLSEISLEDCRAFVGDGARNLVERALRANGVDDGERVEKLTAEYVGGYNADPYFLTELYDGVREIINELSERGFILAVLSNKPDSSVKPIIEKFLPGVFRAVRGARAGEALKPQPDTTYALIDELGLAPEECAFVGDTGIDILTAKNASLALSVGVAWGFRDAEHLADAGADIVVSKATDFLAEVLPRA
ncbi:MAG: HAD hydrolase-like protein [Clostridia bacterium]|nr:HAD hydrolase-like protein [Clostridia bacterium]